MDQAILNRIEALEAKTEANGCTPAEAGAAKAKAKELRAKYNVPKAAKRSETKSGTKAQWHPPVYSYGGGPASLLDQVRIDMSIQHGYIFRYHDLDNGLVYNARAYRMRRTEYRLILGGIKLFPHEITFIQIREVPNRTNF